MKKLFLIPARGGSKGLPNKNIKLLKNKPLISYTIEAARDCKDDGDVIAISTDDVRIANLVRNYGVDVPFLRPPELAKDDSTMEDVINHALEWYASNGILFDLVLLLQPTSPLRSATHIQEALQCWNSDIDMVVSVKKSSCSPYYNTHIINEKNFLQNLSNITITRRQDSPEIFQYNGAIYIFQFKHKFKFKELIKIKGYIMSEKDSIDIDDEMQFQIAELFI